MDRGGGEQVGPEEEPDVPLPWYWDGTGWGMRGVRRAALDYMFLSRPKRSDCIVQRRHPLARRRRPWRKNRRRPPNRKN